MPTERCAVTHEFLPGKASSYLIEESGDFRKKALNAISESASSFIKQAGNGKDGKDKVLDAVRRFMEIMKKVFLEHPLPAHRIGGLIGLASLALALNEHLDEHADEFIKTALPYFSDQDSAVRYYSCESLYNIFKKAPKGVIRCLGDIFDGICKICCDVDEDVKQTSQVINRLLRDIVLDETPPIEAMVDLIASRMHVTNCNVRCLLMSWIMTINSIPGVNMMDYLPKVYIGLFNMLVDNNREVRGAAELCLSEFLAGFKRKYSSKVEIVKDDLFKVILLNNKRTEHLARKTNIVWVRELAMLQPQVVYFDGFPLFLKSVIMSIADNSNGTVAPYHRNANLDVSAIAQEANKQLLQTVREGKMVADVENITKELTEVIEGSSNQVVMLTILQWFTLLLVLKPRVMVETVPAVVKAVMMCFKQSDSELILEETLKAITLLLELGDQNHQLLSQHLVELFKTEEALLEERGRSIIISLCNQIGFERFYKVTTDCLSQQEDEQFLCRVVYTLNWTLLTSDEAKKLRKFLLTEEGDPLGSQLQLCWEHNMAASLSLALWREKYELANEIVEKMYAPLLSVNDVSGRSLTLVQLLDSHVFMKMRLHLLKPKEHPQLLQALLGLSMILPQSKTNRQLMRRLKVSQLAQTREC